MSNSRSEFSLCGENVSSLGGVPTPAQGGIMLFQGDCLYCGLVHGLVPKNRRDKRKNTLPPLFSGEVVGERQFNHGDKNKKLSTIGLWVDLLIFYPILSSASRNGLCGHEEFNRAQGAHWAGGDAQQIP